MWVILKSLLIVLYIDDLYSRSYASWTRYLIIGNFIFLGRKIGYYFGVIPPLVGLTAATFGMRSNP
jgi:hypothetical protein